MFNPPSDIAELVSINDTHRRYDATDSDDLWTLSQVGLPFAPEDASDGAPAPGRLQRYAFPAPTFLPGEWSQGAMPTQDAYNTAFRARFPQLVPALAVEHVVVAGGAAAAILHGGEAGDVDLFFVGMDPADFQALWAKVHETLEAVKGAFDKTRWSLATFMRPGVVTVYAINDRESAVKKFQLILRVFPTVSALLHGFDIPAACVAYRGGTTFLTTLGAYANIHRVNVVVPAYRSTTYESRLAKYFARGFAIALPGLRADAFGVASLALPHIAFAVAHTLGHCATGTVRVEDGQPSSDYEATDFDRDGNAYVVITGLAESQAKANSRELARGSRRYTVSTALEHYNDWGEEHLLPCLGYGSRPGPTLPELLPFHEYEKRLDRAVRAAARFSSFNLSALWHTLGMTHAEIATYTAALLDTASRHPRSRLDASQALAPYVERLRARWCAECAVPIEWWITVDPGRQYTASLNPRIEDPAVWYGAAYAAEAPASLMPAAEVRRLLADCADETCAICLTPLTPNSVTLGCGHRFHWHEPHNVCGGILQLVEGGATACPMCRAPFRGRESPAAKGAVMVRA